jgi:stage IV sporulation protein FB
MSFKVLGINIKIRFMFSAVIMLLLIFDESYTAIFTLLSAFLHEIAHLACFFYFGQPPKKVELGAFGIKMDKGPYDIRLSLKRETKAALAGPIINLLVAAVFACFYKHEMAAQITAINLSLATFNLLPIFELDGGRALYYLISERYNIQTAQRVLDAVSVFTLFLLYLSGTLVIIYSGVNFTLIGVAVYLTILTLSKRYM